MLFKGNLLGLAFLGASAVVASPGFYPWETPQSVYNGQQPIISEPVLILNNGSQAQNLHLSSLQEDGFASLSHPRFPNHRVRVKKSNFCDPTVK